MLRPGQRCDLGPAPAWRPSHPCHLAGLQRDLQPGLLAACGWIAWAPAGPQIPCKGPQQGLMHCKDGCKDHRGHDPLSREALNLV